VVLLHDCSCSGSCNWGTTGLDGDEDDDEDGTSSEGTEGDDGDCGDETDEFDEVEFRRTIFIADSSTPPSILETPLLTLALLF